MTNGLDTQTSPSGTDAGSTSGLSRRGTRRKAGAAGDVSDSVVEPKAAAAEPQERDDHLLGSIESVMLSVDRPVSVLRLAEALGLIAADDDAEEEPAGEDDDAVTPKTSPHVVVKRAVAALNREYEATGRAFRIEAVAGGYRLMTLAKFAPVIEEFLGKRERTALSRPAVETLAIIAYKQPMTRAQLEAVRGVACGEVLKTLVERRLVTITGRAEELGRPMLYGTTRPFLEAFGLSSLKDLPSIEEFRARHAGGGEE